MKASLFLTCFLISVVSHVLAADNVPEDVDISSELEQRGNDSGHWGQTRYENGGYLLLKNFEHDDEQNASIDEHKQDTDNVREFEEHTMSSESDETVRLKVLTLENHSAAFGEPSNSSAVNFANQPHRISARETDVCKYPKDLKDSELHCTIYPSKVVCDQTCMFGFTLLGRDGIRRRMECKKDENRWKPVAEFEKCKPFVDCGVTLGPGGSYKCRKNYMHKGADCDISCSQYEEMEAVPVARYECDIRGNWTPKLPFCARPGSGLKLIRPPHGPRKISDL